MFVSNNFDNKLIAAFELYNNKMIEALPSDKELSKIQFSPAFEKKMKKLLSLQKKTYYYLINTVGKRVAIILLTIIISLTATTLSVKSLREAVFEFITETHKKYTKISVDSSEPTSQTVIKTAPQYVPEGYKIESEIDVGNFYSIAYVNNDNIKIRYDQEIHSGTTIHVDTEGVEVERIYINSLEGISYVTKGWSTVIFADENHIFTVAGEIPMEEIIKMAESINLK